MLGVKNGEIDAAQIAMATAGGLGALGMEQSLFGSLPNIGYDLDMSNDEEIISDEEFLKSLTKQE